MTSGPAMMDLVDEHVAKSFQSLLFQVLSAIVMVWILRSSSGIRRHQFCEIV